MTRMYIAIGTAVIVVLGFVTYGVAARSDGSPTMEESHMVVMTESAQALQQAGSILRAHGQSMLDEGGRNGDQQLIADGLHWVQDGQAFMQRGQWLAMAPNVPGGLLANPGQLASDGSWAELSRSVQQMMQDPRHAGHVDLDALQWDGEAMRAEGQLMINHGKVMVAQAEQMISRHGLQGQDATDLRTAAATLVEVGNHLEANGKEMTDYAKQLRQSLGED